MGRLTLSQLSVATDGSSTGNPKIIPTRHAIFLLVIRNNRDSIHGECVPEDKFGTQKHTCNVCLYHCLETIYTVIKSTK